MNRSESVDNAAIRRANDNLSNKLSLLKNREKQFKLKKNYDIISSEMKSKQSKYHNNSD